MNGIRGIWRGALCVLACLTLGGGSMALAQTPETVTVDFSRREGVPLIKKFGLYNSGLVPLAHYERDQTLLDGLRAPAMRVDLFMGGEGTPLTDLAGGTAEALTMDFSELDNLVGLLDAHGLRPYMSWCYIPRPLQNGGNWRAGPTSLSAWREMFRRIGAHWKDGGLPAAYHEIYNEPDNRDFFLGDMADYTEMYVSAAQGLRQGNPDAVIGGPSTAFIARTGAEAMRQFLSGVLESGAALDFFSYHSCGSDEKQYLRSTAQARAVLSEYPALDAVEMHLNEYNSLAQPFLPDGPAEHAAGGATLLTSFELLLEETDVTMACWAQFMDTGYEPLGSVDYAGRMKAAYRALWMYGRMPEERVSVTGLSQASREGLHAMASEDEEAACVLIWNDGAETAEATLVLSGLPADATACERYEISDEQDPYWTGQDPGRVEPSAITPADEGNGEVKLSLSPGAFTLLRFPRASEKTDAASPVGRVVRERYYFPERGKSSYAFFDENEQVAYLGMEDEASARAVAAAEYEALPDQLLLDAHFTGSYQEIDLNTSFSVRVDYAVRGAYERAVTFTFLPVNPRRVGALPWGTAREPEEVILTDSLLTGRTLLNLRAHAPKDWDGRAIVTFDMHSTGPGTRVELRLAPLSP